MRLGGNVYGRTSPRDKLSRRARVELARAFGKADGKPRQDDRRGKIKHIAPARRPAGPATCEDPTESLKRRGRVRRDQYNQADDQACRNGCSGRQYVTQPVGRFKAFPFITNARGRLVEIPIPHQTASCSEADICSPIFCASADAPSYSATMVPPVITYMRSLIAISSSMLCETNKMPLPAILRLFSSL